MQNRICVNKGLLTLALICFSGSLLAKTALELKTSLYTGIKEFCPEETQECVHNYLQEVTRGLCAISIENVDPSFWQTSRKQQPLPKYKEMSNPPKEIPINQLRFMQASASGNFNSKKSDLIELARDLQSGKVSVQDLPELEVWQDENGKIWTTNHRRLIAIILSGTTLDIPVKFVGKDVVDQNTYEFTTTNDGSKIYVWITDDVALVVGNDNRCAINKAKKDESTKKL